jgi:hypothetical protein
LLEEAIDMHLSCCTDPSSSPVILCYDHADRKNVILCGCAQYVNLWGTLVGYTITASSSMM